MLLKHVYMGQKFQRILKLSIFLSLKHFFILVGISTQVALAPLKFRVSQVVHETVNFVINFWCSVTVVGFEHFYVKIKT